MKVLEQTLRESGEILLEGFSAPVAAYTHKGAIDLVTEWDLKSEQAVRRNLLGAFPGEVVVGEENGGTYDGTGTAWIVDPLDGTTNFVHRLPFFCVSIGCVTDGVPVAGGVYAPALRQLWLAERGQGAWNAGRRLSVSTAHELEKSLIVTGFSYERTAGLERVLSFLRRSLVSSQGVRRLGSSALDLAYIASGSFEAYVEWGIHAWDIAAGALLVSEAGGRVTMTDGSRLDLFGREIAASNGLVHRELLESLVGGGA